MRSTKYRDEYLVYECFIGGIDNMSESQRMRAAIGQWFPSTRAKHTIGHSDGVNTGHTNHTECTAGRCRHGTYSCRLHELWM